MKYQVYKERRISRRLLAWLGVTAGVSVVLACMVAILALRSTSTEDQKQVLTTTKQQAASSGAISSKILFVGDVMWGRTVETRALASKAGFNYLTSGLTRADRTAYDAWIANFECPITDNNEPVATQISALKFNCRPEFLPNLATWFTAASQANNHTMNQGGQTGLSETRTQLDKFGIQHFGNYDMNQLDDICEVITVPATTATTHKKVSLPIAMCGYMYVVNVPPTQPQLAVMARYAKVMPVIAFPHMGVEYRKTAEPEKVSAYRQMIDNGADAVIGAHPHVIQNSENYKGRLIAYSLGNFVFDQQSLGQDTTIGLAVGLNLTIKDEAAARVYERIAPSCKAYKDDCVSKLTSALPQRPAITVAYRYVCYDQSVSNGRVPKRGSEQVCNLAKQWATVDRLSELSSQW